MRKHIFYSVTACVHFLIVKVELKELREVQILKWRQRNRATCKKVIRLVFLVDTPEQFGFS